VSFFKRLAKAAAPADDLAGDADAHRFRAELAKGRWHGLHDFLEATRDWDSRDFYIARLSNISGRPGWLNEWAAARPASSLPFLFRGTQGMHWAWQARGSGYAKTVQRDAWQVFYARLVEAERDLAKAAAMDEEDPTPHARSIRAANGLNLGLDEKKRRFAEAARRHRWHVGAHTNMIQALSAKWSGSHAAMFEFARSASAQAPDGHSVHKVIALAHIERWLSLPGESPDGKARQGTYFADRLVREEVNRAAESCVRSAAYAESLFTPADRNAFAMCFWLMSDYNAQLEQMGQIGSLIEAIPWQYLGDPGRAYERARAAAMQATSHAGQQSAAP
jgi:hypothetical protein